MGMETEASPDGAGAPRSRRGWSAAKKGGSAREGGRGKSGGRSGCEPGLEEIGQDGRRGGGDEVGCAARLGFVAQEAGPGRLEKNQIMAAVAGFQGGAARPRAGPGFRQAFQAVFAFLAHADAGGAGEFDGDIPARAVAEDDLGQSRQDGEGHMQQNGQNAKGRPRSAASDGWKHTDMVVPRPPPVNRGLAGALKRG